MRTPWFDKTGRWRDSDLAQLLLVAALALDELEAHLKTRDNIAAIRAKVAAFASDGRPRPLGVSVTLRFGRLAAALDDPKSSVRAVEVLRKNLRSILTPLRTVRPFDVQLTTVPTHLPEDRLVTLLSTQPCVESVVFQHGSVPPTQWAWPLRIAVESKPPHSSNLAGSLPRGHYAFLYQALGRPRRGDSIDLLIVQDDLAHARAQAIKRASVVLVLAESASSVGPSTREELQELQRRHGAGLVGICVVPAKERVAWMQALVRELSHNRLLPACLFTIRQPQARAGEGGKVREVLPAPLLVGNATFIKGTSLNSAARRLKGVLQEMHEGGPRRGARVLERELVELSRALPQFQWLNEGGDAKGFVQMNQRIERQVGRRLLDQRLRTATPEVRKASRPPVYASIPASSFPVARAPASSVGPTRPPAASAVVVPTARPVPRASPGLGRAATRGTKKSAAKKAASGPVARPVPRASAGPSRGATGGRKKSAAKNAAPKKVARRKAAPPAARPIPRASTGATRPAVGRGGAITRRAPVRRRGSEGPTMPAAAAAPPKQRTPPRRRPRQADVASASDFDFSGAVYDAVLETRELPPRVRSARPLEEEPEVPRHVHAQCFARAGDEEANTRPAKTLAVEQTYTLRVHIGPRLGKEFAVAEDPVDESQLPPSDIGHALEIAYCPLSPVRRQDKLVIPSPQRATIFLPKVGTSDVGEFDLQVGPDVPAFRARLIITHANRVVQTLLLTSGSRRELKLDVENVFAPDFRVPHEELPAHISFVVNDSAQGVSGIATLLDSRAEFAQPEGIKTLISKIQDALTAANVAAVGRPKDNLASDEMLKLVRRLATWGSVILRELAPALDDVSNQKMAPFRTATRVQVVEAVEKAYFPVEFLYSGPSPESTAVLCPKAKAALADLSNQLHEQCEHRSDRNFVCPAAFWGLNKCIERHPPRGGDKQVFSIPQVGNDRLGPFQCALFAASERAKTQVSNSASLTKSIKKLTGANSHKISTWKDWRTQVAAKSPALLLLLPHSLNDDEFDLPALEVSGDVLPTSLLDEGVVRSAANRHALVVLLGCETALAEISFLAFARQFNQAGAAAVIATLATVHAKQAAQVAVELLAELQAQADGATDIRLDEAVRNVKRRLLADGHEVALSVLSYGNSSWHL